MAGGDAGTSGQLDLSELPNPIGIPVSPGSSPKKKQQKTGATTKTDVEKTAHLSTRQKLDHARIAKDKANTAFTSGNIQEALRLYYEVILFKK